MKYQDNFPTIWDIPLRSSTKETGQAPTKKALASIKKAFASMGFAAKRQPNA